MASGINIGRRTALGSVLLLTTLAHAQKWPERSIKAVVPFPAGGSTDNIARIFAKELAEALAQPVVVENRGGGAGSIGTENVVRAPGDGYSLMFSSAFPLTLVPQLRPTSYTVDDLVPVARLGTYISGFVVRSSLPVKTLKEYVEMAKAQPGKLTFGSSGAGGLSHVRIEALKQAAGINVTHVPYQGGAAAMQDLLGDRIDTMAENIIFPHVKSGKLRMLAILAETRHPDFPDVPTAREAGFPELNTPAVFAAFAPKGTPAAVVQALNAEIVRISRKPQVREKLMGLGFQAGEDTVQEVRAAVAGENAVYARLVKSAQLKAD
jgi:tripartite-type tricarboxylate transporter receptor subunit TctC